MTPENPGNRDRDPEPGAGESENPNQTPPPHRAANSDDPLTAPQGLSGASS